MAVIFAMEGTRVVSVKFTLSLTVGFIKLKWASVNTNFSSRLYE